MAKLSKKERKEKAAKKLALYLGPIIKLAKELNYDTVMVARRDDDVWLVKCYPAA